MIRVPEHGSCFTCGSSNPQGIGITWYIDGEKRVVGEITLSDAQQGPPGYAHGGASAALLDEAMGISVWVAGLRVVATNLNVAFERPVPLGQPVRIRGWVEHRDEDGRVHTQGQMILPNGKVAVSATGTYKEAPHLFDPEFGPGRNSAAG